MESVLEEISYLRRGKPLVVDCYNSNPYRVVVQEPNRSNTAYYFSTPIYHNGTGKLIDLCFGGGGNQISLSGSNAQIRIGEIVWMKNERGVCEIKLRLGPGIIDGNRLFCGNAVVFPTTNGIAVRAGVDGPQSFEIEVENPYMSVRCNDKYFALMDGEFRPFVVLSCIGVVDEANQVLAPARIAYEKITEYRYQIAVAPAQQGKASVLFEINLYEPKLWQDTTVDSRHPTSNNVFGGTAFVGKTTEYGEQWLYTRLDQSKMPELMAKEINRAILYLPVHSPKTTELMATGVSTRFCSLGSTWENKVPPSPWHGEIQRDGRYLSIDITELITNSRTRLLMPSEGLVLRRKTNALGMTVVSTADCYFAPQIFKINCK